MTFKTETGNINIGRLGTWQKNVLIDCSQEPKNPLLDLRGKAALWSGRYKASLKILVQKGLLESGPWGPMGGMRYRATKMGTEVAENLKNA